MSAQINLWRVNSAEGILETDFETLKEWVADGRVLPTDLVSKGSLRPIEARRVPALRSIFLDPGESTPVISPPTEPTPLIQEEAPLAAEVHETPQAADVPEAKRTCHYHPEAEARYVCRVCTSEFCERCAQPAAGSRNVLCALCGNNCNPIVTATTRVERQQRLGEGFGVADFARAVRYPFQHLLVLLFGAVLYGLLGLAGFWGQIAAYTVMFGCITQVISQVAWGRIEANFMPDFSEFSMWDDVAVPLGLGLGITIVTWGPTILLVAVLVFGFGGAARSSLAGAPPTNEQALSREDISTLANPEADPKKLEEANKKLNQLRPGHELSQEAERTKDNDPLAGGRSLMLLLGGSVVIILLGFITVAWGIFYYPMALAVAGYTETFSAVVNPMVGLDTIKRMGSTYFKAFGMILGIQAVSLVTSLIVFIVTSPFNLPFVGNLPGAFVRGAFTFYFNLVIACLLGLSLYKSGDRLGIEAD